MPNNFRLTGNYYVSKFGNDAWSGTSPDAPKRTIQAALTAMTSNQTLVIGSGTYSETISKTIALYSISVVADGEVILDGFNKSAAFACSNQGFIWSFTGITFKNYSSISINNNNTGTHNNFVSACTFINSVFSVGGINTTSGVSFTSCKFINSSCLGSSGIDYFNLSLFVNSSISNCLTFTNCYVENSSVLSLNSAITAANFNFNNIQGSIVMNVASSITTGVIQDTYGRYYDLSQAGSGGSGSLLEPYKRGDTLGKRFNFANHRIAYPTMNASSSAVDPKFNSIEDQDFTLQAGSWHIGRASDGISNIGGTKYAIRRTSKSNTFSGSSVTVDPSLIFQYDNYIISGSQVTGSVTSAPIAVNTSVPKVIQKVTYNGLLAFNKDTGSASGSNQNVPDFDTFTSASGNAAANPDRLVYYMRHTTGSSIPVSDANWDNGGLWTAGQYNVFEWNTKPSIDNNGVGNGSGSFNAAVTPTFIQATYVQMQVKLRNDYLL